MKLKIKIICLCLAAVLLSTLFVGCAPEQEWTDENVIFTYDDIGNVTITFPDNFVYPKYPKARTIEFNVPDYPYLADFYEWFDSTLKQNGFGSVYLIKVIKLLTVEEAEKLDAYTLPTCNYTTYYEVVVIYDYINEKEINEVHYFQFVRGTADSQRKGLPPFQNGDTFVAISAPIAGCSVIGCVVMDPFYILDKEINDQTIVFKMSGPSQDMANIAIELTEEEKTRESAYEENPRRFFQKFKLGDLIEFIRNALEERGYEIQK